MGQNRPKGIETQSGDGRRLALHDYLPYRLSVTSNAISSLIARAYEDQFGLSIPQWRLIAVLADEGPLTPQTLCRRTLMDKVSVGRAAQGLLKRKLIKRIPHATDGRSHHLLLTSAGQRTYAQIVPLALEYEAALLEGISIADVDELKRTLLRLQESAAGLTRSKR